MILAREPIDFSHMPRADVSDDGGKVLDAILCVTAEPAHAVYEAVRQGYAVMPAGGLTSAINSFIYDRPGVLDRFADVVAIRPKGALAPELVAGDTPMETLLSHQVAIDREARTITAGVGLTFTQVNAVLAEQVAPNCRVLVDLTSVASAFVGGVVATGGMGPLRLRPSHSLEAICLADGAQAPRVLTGDEMQAEEGMQGWTGLITAVRMRYYETPPFEFGLVLPMQFSDVDGVADLLAYLYPFTELALDGHVLTGKNGETTVLNGVELVSRQSLEEFIEHASDPARSKAVGLLQSCDYASADILVCLTGWTDGSVDDALMTLLDEETETIGGVGIDFGVGFSSGSEMEVFRAIREGAPDLARTRARVTQPGKLKPWTTSSDINIHAPRDSAAISELLGVYAEYRQAVDDLRQSLNGRAETHLSAYGHLSPLGIDTHHRVTVIAPEGGEAALAEAQKTVAGLKKDMIRQLVAASIRYGSQVTGGEKGVPSLVEIARALGGAEALPDNLRTALARARERIRSAPANFSFRAPAELAD